MVLIVATIFRARTFQIPLPAHCERNLLCHQNIAFQDKQQDKDQPSHLDPVVSDHTPKVLEVGDMFELANYKFRKIMPKVISILFFKPP